MSYVRKKIRKLIFIENILCSRDCVQPHIPIISSMQQFHEIDISSFLQIKKLRLSTFKTLMQVYSCLYKVCFESQTVELQIIPPLSILMTSGQSSHFLFEVEGEKMICGRRDQRNEQVFSWPNRFLYCSQLLLIHLPSAYISSGKHNCCMNVCLSKYIQ